MALDRAFLTRWSRVYLADLPAVEADLFDRVGPAVRRRGHYERDEFLAVGRWKSPRPIGRLAANSDDDIVDITRIALSAPTRLQHRLLVLLNGVQTPMATALLAVAVPDAHTIFDVRASEALARLGAWDGAGGYDGYREASLRVALKLRTDLRTLDRALWQWSKAGHPDPKT